jgi:Family of unknown function (DUF6352)
MPDFWPSCGYRLLEVDEQGRLRVTPAFLRSYLLRPELAPIPESCADEHALHERLLRDPAAQVTSEQTSRITDPDARENYSIWLRFRDRLLRAPTLESGYAALFSGEGVDVPPSFVAQLTQILLRHILGESADPMQARAAEMLFRVQKISIAEGGAVMAADELTIERFASASFGALSELLAQNRTPARSIDLDVLDNENALRYWDADERFDFAVSINRGRPALEALCRVLERWIGHFLAVEVSIATQREIKDARWVWHVGLDAEASSLLNDLYNRVEVSDERRERLLCLFELNFADPSVMRPAIAGRPVYLAMAMDGERRLRLKPQNLLLNLPLARIQ